MIKLYEYSAGDFVKDIKYRFKVRVVEGELEHHTGADTILKLLYKLKLYSKPIITGRGKMNDTEYTVIGEYKDCEDFRDSFVELLI